MHYGPIRHVFGVLGDWLGCHQMPERSIFIGRIQFPVCARCAGVYLGQTLMLLAVIAGFRISVVLCIALMFPMGLDWSVQYVGLIESTNRRRLITGLLGGAGYIGLLTYLLLMVTRWMFDP